MATELQLFAYMLGLGRPAFSITINGSKTVGDLKDAILMKKPNLLKNVDAAQLTLWKVLYF